MHEVETSESSLLDHRRGVYLKLSFVQAAFFAVKYLYTRLHNRFLSY
jgi:hypothetical protein